MNRLENLKSHLRPGRVYRRSDLAKWSKSVDRHARELVAQGVLHKVRNGMYLYPKESAFGPVPAREKELVKSFLKDDDFLLTSPNAYNSLGLGTTQLYNKYVVYNHKRHEIVELGNHTFEFRRKPRFPSKLSEEFLLVDLMNNLASLAEDTDVVCGNLKSKARELDSKKLRSSVRKYGKVATRKFFEQIFADAT